MTVNSKILKKLYEDKIGKIDVKLSSKKVKDEDISWTKEILLKKIETLNNLYCKKHPNSDFARVRGYSVHTETYICADCALESLTKMRNDYGVFVLKNFGQVDSHVDGTRIYTCFNCGFTTKHPISEHYYHEPGPLSGGEGHYIKCGNCGALLHDDVIWVS
jgi:hypothetical protein